MSTLPILNFFSLKEGVLYKEGMTTGQISEAIKDMYGFDISEGSISDVTDKILPQIEQWNRTR